jgi:hypothetical protein
MGDYARGGLDLQDEDRLPWLEPAETDYEPEGVSPLKLLGFIIVGLAALGVVLAGVWWLKQHGMDGAGSGELIAAPAGDYKVPADEADARKFAGEGDASFAASEGVERDIRIDPSRVPEAPVVGKPAATPAVAQPVGPRPANRVSAPVADATGAPRSAPKNAGAPAGAMIQLGAYGSEAGAKEAWKKLSARFTYLAPLAMSVQSVEVGGTTLHRLRASAGAQAGAICGKLKVAGENCIVVN